MSKVIALCCILLPIVCHGACAPGTDTCNQMDEAALVQKDLSLSQKSLQQPADIDRKTAAKHISQALSLQYLSQAFSAKLELVKKHDDEFKLVGDQVLAATAKYKSSEHSEAEFETWYAAVSEGLGKTVSSVASTTKTAEADSKVAKEALMESLEKMEEQLAYGDKVTKVAVQSQLSAHGSILANLVKEQNGMVLKAMEAYEEETKNGFTDEAFRKPDDVITAGVASLKGSIAGWVQVYEGKATKIKDAKMTFTAHTAEELNDAIWQLVSFDKTLARTALATKLSDGFTPHEGAIIENLKVFSESKRSKTDFKKFRTTLWGIIEKTVSLVKSENDLDEAGEEEGKKTLVASFNNLGDERELTQKVVKFATAWGRHRLESDLLAPVYMEQEKVKEALDTYEKKTAGKYSGVEFGKLYQQVIETMIILKSQFAGWTSMSGVKKEELQPGNVKLQSFQKQ